MERGFISVACSYSKSLLRLMELEIFNICKLMQIAQVVLVHTPDISVVVVFCLSETGIQDPITVVPMRALAPRLTIVSTGAGTSVSTTTDLLNHIPSLRP